MNSSYSAPTSPLFSKLKILPYHSLIDQSKLILMHSIHYHTASHSLHNLWALNADKNLTYNLRNNNEYKITRVNYSFYTRSPVLPNL